MAGLLAACGPDYSPNTYTAGAVQQANKVDKGVIVGVRQIDIAAGGVTGTAAGAAAGGALGSNAPGGGLASTFGAIGGGLLGGIAGNATEHVAGDTTAFEYIVRKPNGELVSVTQKDTVALAVGERVLVIAGAQARIVPDYTVAPEPPAQGATPAAPVTPSPGTPAPVTPAPMTPAPVTSSPLPPAPADAAAPATPAPDKPSAPAVSL